ncbi:hypothetical protein FA13DRAFT_1757116 [Coprinellus micaceus]|uniref:DUF6830 domain-containing protein n=1 Tax=Coprinellus micaceus TaxID=71717 RepID=A0A4Y7SNJ5_COPMI|nr:hypothetical protein FA13DRAFT_1757116 [Coprinellus micaceus]
MSSGGDQVNCPGCGASVLRSYLILHTRRTSDERCRSWYRRYLLQAIDDLDSPAHPPRCPSSESGSALSTPEVPELPISAELQGDLFGDYEDEDYQGDFQNSFPVEDEDIEMEDNSRGAKNGAAYDDDSSSVSDSDSEILLEDSIHEDGEGSFELERPGAPGEVPQGETQGDPPEELPTTAGSHPPATPLPRPLSPSQSPVVTIRYGHGAGEPLPADTGGDRPEHVKYQQSLKSLGQNIYHPFQSRLEWEFARWAKFRGPSSTAVSELLGIEGVVEKLGLSFKNSRELNQRIDEDLPGRPQFLRRNIEVGGEIFKVYFRDVEACIRALFADPRLAPHLKHAPEKHFADEEKVVRIYHDIHTGEWWWSTQELLDADVGPGRTIIPIIISSDKTQLTLFRNKAAYPLYMTIGNIPKELRRKPSFRAYVLLGYLPTSRLSHITCKAARRRCLSNLYHACLERILRPLQTAGKEGMEVSDGLGMVRCCHPIFATFIGDYPEQVLVTGVITGDCVKCPIPKDQLGDPHSDPGGRSLKTMLDLLDDFDNVGGSYVQFSQGCKDARLKPIVAPFWANLAYAHVYRSITPDVLHQLYQGVMKHMVGWLVEVYGAAEIDARCRRLPPNHNIRLFMKGISSLSRVTGQEHTSICQFLLALVIDAVPVCHSPTTANTRHRLLKSLRGLLDFLFLAQYPIHTTMTLRLMDDALARFHADKDVFIELGLHFAIHYVHLIKLFGTTDNFNTEYTERLHIDLAKDAYAATNRKDEYPQMTVMHMAKHPSVQGVYLEDIKSKHGATHFRVALARYIVLTNDPDISQTALESRIRHLRLPFRKVPVWHRIKWLQDDAYTRKISTIDSVHSRALQETTRGSLPARFDTVLVDEGTGGEHGLSGRRVGRVRVIFSIPDNSIRELFNEGVNVPYHFAYIDWFTPFKPAPEPHHGLYKISYSRLHDGSNLSSIIPIANIFRSIHLFPSFGRAAPVSWSSDQVLDQCKAFFLNPFTDKHLFRSLM